MIKHFKEFCAWLMYSADDGATALRQRLEQCKALETRSAIQSTAVNKHHNHPHHSYYDHRHHLIVTIITTRQNCT